MAEFPFQFEGGGNAPILILYCEADSEEALVFEKTCSFLDESKSPFWDVILYRKGGDRLSIVLSQEDADILGHLLLGSDEPLDTTPILDPDKLFEGCDERSPHAEHPDA